MGIVDEALKGRKAGIVSEALGSRRVPGAEAGVDPQYREMYELEKQLRSQGDFTTSEPAQGETWLDKWAKASSAESELMSRPESGPALATLAAGAAGFPVAGLAGLINLIGPNPLAIRPPMGDLDRDLRESGQLVEKVGSFLPNMLLTTDAEKQVTQQAGDILMKPFSMAGAGLGGLAELPTGGLKGATEVIAGTSPGSNIFVPAFKSLGEASALFGLPKVYPTIRGRLTDWQVGKLRTELKDGFQSRAAEQVLAGERQSPLTDAQAQEAADFVIRTTQESGDLGFISAWQKRQQMKNIMKQRGPGEPGVTRAAGFEDIVPETEPAGLTGEGITSLPGGQGFEMKGPAYGPGDLFVREIKSEPVNPLLPGGQGFELVGEPRTVAPTTIESLMQKLNTSVGLPMPAGFPIQGEGFIMQEPRPKVIRRPAEPLYTEGRDPGEVLAEYAANLTKTGTPYKTQQAAQMAIARKGLQGTHEVVPAPGGFGIKKMAISPQGGVGTLQEATPAPKPTGPTPEHQVILERWNKHAEAGEIPSDAKDMVHHVINTLAPRLGFSDRIGDIVLDPTPREQLYLDPNKPEDYAILRQHLSPEDIANAVSEGKRFRKAARHELSPDSRGQERSTLRIYRGATAADVAHEFVHAVKDHGGLPGWAGTDEEIAHYMEDRILKGEEKKITEFTREGARIPTKKPEGGGGIDIPKAPKYSVRAWHGGPHDVKKFSTDKIGTGQGAQAYGYGLYFASQKEVGKHYRDEVGRYITYKGKQFNPNAYDPDDIRKSSLKFLESYGHFGDAIYDLESQIEYDGSKRAGEMLSWIKKNRKDIRLKPEGKLYQVSLAPKPDEYLLWDKPLSQQPEKIKKILQEIAKEIPWKLPYEDYIRQYEYLNYKDEHLRHLYDAYMKIPEESDPMGSVFYQDLADHLDAKVRPDWVKERDRLIKAYTDELDAYIKAKGPKGEAERKKLIEKWKQERDAEGIPGLDEHLEKNPRGDKLASEYLLSKGIRGVKYLDGYSRPQNIGEERIQRAFEKFNGDVEKAADHLMKGVYDTPKGKAKTRAEYVKTLEKGFTHNYVIFSDKDVRIIDEAMDKKYLKAVEKGDMKAAQKMVDEAAAKMGFDLTPYYHGSPHEITKLTSMYSDEMMRGMELVPDGIFFSPEKEYAAEYGDHVYKVYLNFGRPLVIDLDAPGKQYLKEFEWLEKQDDIVGPALKKRGYDSIIYKSHKGGPDSEVIIFDSNKIKSAEPITRDDNGKVIPLSERFNEHTPDIRYSVRIDDPLEQSRYSIRLFSEEKEVDFKPLTEAVLDGKDITKEIAFGWKKAAQAVGVSPEGIANAIRKFKSYNAIKKIGNVALVPGVTPKSVVIRTGVLNTPAVKGLRKERLDKVFQGVQTGARSVETGALFEGGAERTGIPKGIRGLSPEPFLNLPITQPDLQKTRPADFHYPLMVTGNPHIENFKRPNTSWDENISVVRVKPVFKGSAKANQAVVKAINYAKEVGAKVLITTFRAKNPWVLAKLTDIVPTDPKSPDFGKYWKANPYPPSQDIRRSADYTPYVPKNDAVKDAFRKAGWDTEKNIYGTGGTWWWPRSRQLSPEIVKAVGDTPVEYCDLLHKGCPSCRNCQKLTYPKSAGAPIVGITDEPFCEHGCPQCFVRLGQSGVEGRKGISIGKNAKQGGFGEKDLGDQFRESINILQKAVQPAGIERADYASKFLDKSPLDKVDMALSLYADGKISGKEVDIIRAEVADSVGQIAEQVPLISDEQVKYSVRKEEPEYTEADLFYDSGEVWTDVVQTFLDNPNKPQPWKVVPYGKVRRIWDEFSRTGHVSDLVGLQAIGEQMVENVFKLKANTEMAGHTSASPADMVEEYLGVEWTDKLYEKFADYVGDRISDYALDPLLNDVLAYRQAKTPERQLVILDRMLNRIHQRGDIAALFIQGGTQSLIKLADVNGPQYSIRKEGPAGTTLMSDPFGIQATKEIFKALREKPGQFKMVLNKNDLSTISRVWNGPHWIAQKNRHFKPAYDRQILREETRSRMLAERLKGWESARKLSPENLGKLRDLIWKAEGRKFKDVTIGRFVWEKPEGERARVKGLNLKHYGQIEAILSKRGIPPEVIKAFIDIQKHFDRSYAMVYNRLREMRDIDDSIIDKYRKEIGMIPNYFPHHRYGDWYLRAFDKDGNLLYREQFFGPRKLAQGRASIAEKRESANYPDAKWEFGKVEGLPDELYDFPIPVEAMEQLINAAADKLADSKAKEAIRSALPEAVADVMKSRGWGSHMIKRKNIPGFEKEDILKVLYDYDAGLVGWLTKMDAARDFSSILSKIDAKKTPETWTYTSRYIRDVLANSDSHDRIVDTLRSAIYLKYLGGVIKSGAVNALTQNMITGIPRLSMDVGPYAYRYFKDAGSSIVAAFSDMKNLTPDEARLFRELLQEKVISDQYTEEVKGQVEGHQILNKMLDIAGLPMSISEKFNRASLALAAFRSAVNGKITNPKALAEYGLEKGQKADYETAKRFAHDIVSDAHFVYGKGNYPEMLRGSVPAKYAKSGYSLKSFSHNLFQLWGKMLREGPRGWSALAQSILLWSTFWGGLKAIPFVAVLFSVYQAVFGKDPQEEIRKRIADAPGERKNLLRDIVTYGAPAVAGVDIHGSLEIGNVNISNPIKEIFGVPYSMLYEEPAKAFKALRSGQPMRAVEEIAPTVIKNPMAAYRLYSQGQHSISGQPVNLPGEQGPRKISGLEAVGKGLGIQPVSSSKASDVYESMRGRQEYVQNKQSRWANRLANAQLKEDQAEVDRILEEVRTWNEANPEFPVSLKGAMRSRRQKQPPKRFRAYGKELTEGYQ